MFSPGECIHDVLHALKTSLHAIHPRHADQREKEGAILQRTSLCCVASLHVMVVLSLKLTTWRLKTDVFVFPTVGGKMSFLLLKGRI